MLQAGLSWTDHYVDVVSFAVWRGGVRRTHCPLSNG